MNPEIYAFENQECTNMELVLPVTTNSWIYFWVDAELKQIVYIGEYGKATTYDLLTRLRRSIGALSHNTMDQLRKNSLLTGYDVSRKLKVYCYELNSGLDSDDVRKQIESWCNWMTVINKTYIHKQYCGFSYKGVTSKTKMSAQNIYNNLVAALIDKS